MVFIKEFKEFALRGNILDLAIAVVIGTSFGKIVTSFVNDILMPPIGVLIGGVRFNDLKFILKQAIIDSAGVVTKEAVTWNYGNFIQSLIDFTIIAFFVFLMFKVVKSFRAPEPVVVVAVPREEQLLEEIRDLLKERK